MWMLLLSAILSLNTLVCFWCWFPDASTLDAYRRSASFVQLHAIDARSGKLKWCKSETISVNFTDRLETKQEYEGEEYVITIKTCTKIKWIQKWRIGRRRFVPGVSVVSVWRNRSRWATFMIVKWADYLWCRLPSRLCRVSALRYLLFTFFYMSCFI